MTIIFIGSFLEPSQEQYLRTITQNRVVVSADTFQKALLSGFVANSIKPSFIVNAPAIGSYPNSCEERIIPRSEFNYLGIPGVNCPFNNTVVLNRRTKRNSIIKEAGAWIESNGAKDITLVVYSLISSYIEAAVKLKKKYNAKICCIVADLPEYFSAPNNLALRMSNNYERFITDKLSKQIDSFVLMTEAMKVRLNVGERPWMILEGIYEEKEIGHISNIEGIKGKFILYTGSLDSRYGINRLIDSFMLIDKQDVSLAICGNGNKGYVLEKANEDNRIKYLGILKHDEVLKLQRKATLLVNPRDDTGEYTKYSFPSKTIEYMASGTPTLMFKLPGTPDEYDKHVVYFPDSSVESMAKTMSTWLDASEEQRRGIGEGAREFILCKKTASAQVKRLIEMIE